MSDAKLRELPPRFWLTCPNCDNTGECHCDENGCAPHSSSYLEPPDDYFECDDCGGTRVCKVCKGAGVVPLSDEEAREMLAAEPEPELRIDIYARGFNEGFASALEQCGMEQVIPVAPEPDPAPSVTDAMVDAGLEQFAWLPRAANFPERKRKSMRAALEAAERVRREQG